MPGCPRTPRTWLVLPTYNEADNLEAIVAAVLEHLPADRRVLVVDDSSPDGTGEIADRLAGEHGDVEVLHRARKEGLGPAYVAGFRQGARRAAPSSSPRWTPTSPTTPPTCRDCSPPSSGADLVLGSRYVAGGGVADWGAIRRLISRGGSAYARGCCSGSGSPT